MGMRRFRPTPHQCGKGTAKEGSLGLGDAVNTTKGRGKGVRLENVQESKISVNIMEGTARAAVIEGTARAQRGHGVGSRNSEWAQCGQ